MHNYTMKPSGALNVIGLMSGTSGDGIDAALVRINGTGHDVRVALRAFHTLAYPRRLRDVILRVAQQGTVAEVCHLNAVLGEWFARAALGVLHKAGLKPSAVALIGSHGQTIHHLPDAVREPGLGRVRSTLQIAEPSVIAERTGITTVADFRPRDVAAGGQGAPLAPYAHYVLLRHPRRSRLVVNLGGIGNVTYLPAGGSLNTIQAFDTGPGNMVLDALAAHLSGGRKTMDRDGRMAAHGTVDQRLLRQLLDHPFLRKRPPKSTGREEFGASFLRHILSVGKARHPADLMATCSLFTALTIGAARRWLTGGIDEVLIGGGGALNPTLMHQLSDVFTPIPVQRFDEAGWDSKAFEAVAFALFAYQTVHGECTNVPAATGAVHPVVLGKIVPGRWGWRPS
jgi:anhydro-N-acetylmuramic acid kinase